jgi:predicted permease
MEVDLEEEMRLHLELRQADMMAEGTATARAAAEARRRFGNVARLREICRETWGWGWLDSVMQDMRYAWRNLMASPGFAIASIVSLAFGIGANTAIFSILNAVMLRSLPVKDPHRLVQFMMDGEGTLTNPLWEAIRDHQNACADSLAYAGASFDLADDGERRMARGMWVSGDFFKVLGVKPALGRVFTLDDDLPGGGKRGPVAVISHQFWQTRFGGDAQVIGKTVRLDRHVFEIIGVTPPGFKGLDADRGYEVAIPIGCQPLFHPDRSALGDRSCWWLSILGRLQTGLTPRQASARLQVVSPGIMQDTLPGDWDAKDQRDYLKQGLQVVPAAAGFSGLRSQYRVALLTLMTVVGLVLLIACANIANLLLARAAARRHEFAIRMAIGAGRTRLVRQLLSESLLLGLLGIPGGLLLAIWGSRLLMRLFSTTSDPLQIDLSLDGTVLLFTVGVTVATCLIFGLAPALRAARAATNETLRRGARGTVAGASRFGLGKGLVAGQVALSLVLMVAAGLFSGTLRNVLNESLGFDQRHVLAIDIDTLQQVPRDQRTGLFETLLQGVRQVPGVESAAVVLIRPISGSAWNNYLLADGAAERGSPDQVTWLNRISPGYFGTMKTTLVAGRDFEERDKLGSQKVMIIGEKTARDFFGTRNPIGEFLRVGYGTNSKGRFQIIGVVRDMKYSQVKEARRRTAFLALAQDEEPSAGVTILARVAGSAQAVTPGIRAAVARTRPGLSVAFQELETQISESLRQERAVALLASFFGGLALFLAVIGLYGVTSYNAAQRRGEIGIRIALGAPRNSVIRLVLRDVGLILALGSMAGLVIALGLGRLIASLVYGVSPHDPPTLLLAALVLGAAGVVAGVLPAWRASRLDPATALRCE